MLHHGHSDPPECEFPEVWIGTWFHLGFPHPLNITRNEITSKGTCFRKQGSHFLVRERLDNNFHAEDEQVRYCLKCMLIIEKHQNALQYKESYCEPWNPMFAETTFAVSTLCSSIMADSALFYMFRMGPNLEPTACPFDGTHTFSYSTRGGKDICGRPTSQLEQCTDPTRLVFQFQACPDVPGSESADHELSCLATWSEGSSRFLVGQWRSHRRHSSSREMNNYHCFRHERRFENQEVVVKMAQSFKSSCMGLWSVDEGARTFEMTPVSTEFEECGLPSWMTVHRSWKSLDHRMRLEFLEGSSRRMSIFFDGQKGEMQCHDIFSLDLPTQSSSSSSSVESGFGVSGNSKSNEHHPRQRGPLPKFPGQDNQMAVILRHKMGCSMGFTCLHLQRKHSNVIFFQMGNMSRHASDACSNFYFNTKAPFYTLIAEHVSVECPLQGKFQQIPVILHQSVDHFRHSSPCKGWMKGGCPLSSNLQMFSCELSDLPRIADFQCIGSWSNEETVVNALNATIHPVAPRSQHLVLTSSRSTICISYLKEGSLVNITLYKGHCEAQTKADIQMRHEGPCHDALIDSSSISNSPRTPVLTSSFIMLMETPIVSFLVFSQMYL